MNMARMASNIDRVLKAIVDNTENNLRLGLRNELAKIEDFKSSFSDGTRTGEYDRFQVTFQLAGNPITWEFHFDKRRHQFPPDIVVGPDDTDFCPDLENIESFVNWDSSSPTCFIDLMTELFQLYISYQQELLTSLPRLQEQWEDLQKSCNYTDRCEVHVQLNPPGTFNSVANLVFDIPVDLSEIPPYLTQENLGDDKACLQVSFQPPDLTKVVPRLFLSPRLEHAIGGRSSLRIPPWGTSTLSSYLQKIDQLIKNTIEDVCQRFLSRKELVASFLSEFDGSVQEYDSEGFYELTLLLEYDGFHFFVFVIIGEKFPKEQPTLVLQSIFKSRNVYRETLTDYPYSPRWEGRKIIEKIREYLSKIIPAFKQESANARSI